MLETISWLMNAAQILGIAVLLGLLLRTFLWCFQCLGLLLDYLHTVCSEERALGRRRSAPSPTGGRALAEREAREREEARCLAERPARRRAYKGRAVRLSEDRTAEIAACAQAEFPYEHFRQ